MSMKLKSLTGPASILLLSLVTTGSFAADKISPKEFVEEASEAGISEIQTAKLALEKSTSADIKTFARQMIDEHSSANQELLDIARRKNINVASEADLIDRAKAKMLNWRDSDSFDKAYAKNQVNAHENAVELFQKGADTLDDVDLSQFAKAKLSALKQHLAATRQLAAKYDK